MMPDLESIKTACPDVDERLIKEHLSRLGEPYFNRFSKNDICRHLVGLSRLSPENPVEVLIHIKRDGSTECSVLAFDYPSEFSIITGILAAMGFSILSGDAFTYKRASGRPSGTYSGKRMRRGLYREDPIHRRRIIDHFSGVIDSTLSFNVWATEIREKMRFIIGLLEKGDEASVTEARHWVNEMIVSRLSQMDTSSLPVLYPVRIEVDNEVRSCTRLKVVSEDTPCFLYSFSNALSLQRLLIEHVRIRTIHGRIEDQIDLVELNGRPIEDAERVNQVKLLVLLTKQFTYFLSKAPDPYAALSRFGTLLTDILQRPKKGQWIDLLTNPNALHDLARLLGASDFLWEDFIRLQYEALLPMFQTHIERRPFSQPIETMAERLREALDHAHSFQDQKKGLNQFKDQEIFLIDLDYILNPKVDFHTLSERLTRLAEIVINTATGLVYDRLVKRFGRPRTVAGIEAKFAVLGLGKLGGAALGYASDIELLFVYGDSGKTDGEEFIENTDFFDRLVKDVTQFITAKREGIFQIDLRLRPYGNAGPLACSLESFCRYYGQGGQAHSFERLALVRMRPVGGDVALGRRLEHLRDEMVYFSRNIELKELQDLRERQFREKTEGGKLNAKFSPGGLVDLEYSVQMLQVIYGQAEVKLRTPRLHEAMCALSDAGVLSKEEAHRLQESYGFLRKLINGMRMLRGSAKDLFFPPVESLEFAHLARRMGYEKDGPLDPAQQLYIDFETHTAIVRLFVERHFGRDSLPGPVTATVADLILSDSVTKGMRQGVLQAIGFKIPERAYANLKRMAGTGNRRDLFSKLALLACDIFREKPDPDMALNNWERFLHIMASPEFHFNLLLSQPMRLEILLSLFSESQFLADTLVRNPGFLDWVVIPEILHNSRKREDIEQELRRSAESCSDYQEWLNRLRRLRRREILRIGIRDLCLKVPIREVMTELSTVAGAFVQVDFEQALQRLIREREYALEIEDLKNNFCILALGKLGGGELNYSSDIDLVGLWNDLEISKKHKGRALSLYKDLFSRLMENITSDLSKHTEEGYAFRVDLRLRPYGDSGEVVSSFSGLLHYYTHSASIWELQAALKMRPVAGNLKLGYDFIKQNRSVHLKRRGRDGVVTSIERMRKTAIKASSNGIFRSIDVKSGFGGLRDVEFLVQGLQLIHGPDNPGLLEGNTLTALDILQQNGILPRKAVSELREDYIFLRRIEHYLQILEDRRNHSLPRDSDELKALAKRMLGFQADAKQFIDIVWQCLRRVHDTYITYLLDGEMEPGLKG
ncbi:MAG: glutamate-ammonia-ligase adenylyltransferase [Pseudomonadota bacterium]